MGKGAGEESKSTVKRRKRLQEERIAELLDIAAKVFIDEGFAAASTNQIARLANASKTTFYSRFPTKEELFLAVVERRMKLIFERVATFPEGADLRSSLEEFGMNLLQVALSPEQMRLVRMVSMESTKYPELAKRFYENGPGRGERALAEYLAVQIRLGRLSNEDAHAIAGHLMSLLAGTRVRWFVLGLSAEPLSDARLREHVTEVVELFLRAYGRAA
jgi:TetR/AcrR family transcriptional regulator, mexJK operon transcriptional repressor